MRQKQKLQKYHIYSLKKLSQRATKMIIINNLFNRSDQKNKKYRIVKIIIKNKIIKLN